MPPRTRVPASLLQGPFTLAQARDAGVSRRVLQGARFRRLSLRVYVATDLTLDHDLLCRAACLAVPRGVVSHASAALAHGLPLGVREAAPSRPHISTRVGLSTSDRHALVNHVELVPARHIVTTRLGPTTSPARTYVDRAIWLPLEDVVALGDAILRERLATKDELAAMVTWARGRRGVTRARQALSLLDGRARSAMESRTRVLFVLADCPAPEVNAVISDDHGGWLAEADLVWRAARLIVEYDGQVHLSEAQRRVDAQRHNQLVAAGWTVLRLTADDVLKRPWQTVALVKDHLRLAQAA